MNQWIKWDWGGEYITLEFNVPYVSLSISVQDCRQEQQTSLGTGFIPKEVMHKYGVPLL